MVAYPTSLDSFANPTATDLQNSVTVPHDLQHANANDAIEALEAKVGVNGNNFPTGIKLTNTVDITGSASGGYGGGELRFPTTTGGQVVGFTTLSTGGPTMAFDHRATSNTGSWAWRNGTNAATTVADLNALFGSFRCSGTSNRFGTGALGGSGTFLKIGDSSDPNNVFVAADGSGSNVGTQIWSKGTAEIQLLGGGNSVGLRIKDSSGPQIGFYNTAPISKPTATGSRGGNAALASLLTALSNLGLITDSTTA